MSNADITHENHRCPDWQVNRFVRTEEAHCDSWKIVLFIVKTNVLKVSFVYIKTNIQYLSLKKYKLSSGQKMYLMTWFVNKCDIYLIYSRKKTPNVRDKNELSNALRKVSKQ